MKKSNFSGRGTLKTIKNRFEKNGYSADLDHVDEIEEGPLKTKFVPIFPKTIVNKVTSPDVGMGYSLNPYQGCEHGCTYCYARPTHEYWGYNAGVDFEQTILVKENAPELLRKHLKKRTWRVKPIVLSGNTDCYQPAEKKYRITRELLKVFLEHKHPVGIITKNALLSRDLDIITELAKKELILINLSVTTLDEDLRRKLEPRTSSVSRKLNLIEQLVSLNVPTRVMMCPIIPSLNDHEILTTAKRLSDLGVNDFHTHVVRLMSTNEIIFEDWLSHHYPDRTAKVMNQIRSLHNGKTGSSKFGERMKGSGNISDYLRRLNRIARNTYFPNAKAVQLRTDLFERFPDDSQMKLF